MGEDVRVVDLKGIVNGLRNDVQAAGEELERTVATMRVDRAASETKLKEDYEAQIEQQHVDHLDAKAQLEDKIRLLEADHEAVGNEMQDTYDKLEQRFENREPRPEDLEHIAELEESISEANEKLGTQEERLRIMKVEMRNREESYNVKFANDPKVMNESMPWMKPKPGGKNGSTSGGRRKFGGTGAGARRRCEAVCGGPRCPKPCYSLGKT